jgi:hypothetical protein
VLPTEKIIDHFNMIDLFKPTFSAGPHLQQAQLATAMAVLLHKVAAHNVNVTGRVCYFT